jgi:hypothetical protein
MTVELQRILDTLNRETIQSMPKFDVYIQIIGFPVFFHSRSTSRQNGIQPHVLPTKVNFHNGLPMNLLQLWLGGYAARASSVRRKVRDHGPRRKLCRFPIGCWRCESYQTWSRQQAIIQLSFQKVLDSSHRRYLIATPTILCLFFNDMFREIFQKILEIDQIICDKCKLLY